MLLDEIIAILSDEKGTLNSALLKTKVLLHSLGKKDLASWVTNELKGYPEDAEIPKYRVVRAQVKGDVVAFTWRQNSIALPSMHLEDEQRESLTTKHCRLSIGSIEEAVQVYRTKGTELISPLPVEYSVFFQKAVAQGVNVTKVWSEINPMDVENILTEVRSRLLDFMLELRDVVGIDVPEKDLATKAAGADMEKMFSTSIFGSGNNIFIGSHSIQAVANQKDDIEGLIAAIGKLGYEQQELNELRQAVTTDQNAGKTPDVTEGATGRWYSKALKSAGKGVVKGGIDLAASVIVKAMKAYTTGAT